MSGIITDEQELNTSSPNDNNNNAAQINDSSNIVVNQNIHKNKNKNDIENENLNLDSSSSTEPEHNDHHDDDDDDEENHDPTQPLLLPSVAIIQETTTESAYAYLLVSAVCLGSILLGYDIGVISGAILYMQSALALTNWQKEAIMASLNLASSVGCLVGGQLASKFGRRRTIGTAAVIFFFGAIFMASTNVIAVIVVSRVLLGVGAGIGVVVTPLYIAEVAPAHIRGRLLTFDEISINAGILLGFFIAFLFYFATGVSDAVKWKLMVALGTVPAAALFLLVWCVIPESPRFLIEHGRIAEAQRILARLYTMKPMRKNKKHRLNLRDDDSKEEEERKLEMDERQIARVRMDDHNADVDVDTDADDEERLAIVINTLTKDIQRSIHLERTAMFDYGWKNILCSCVYSDVNVQKALLIAVGVCFFQQASGNEATVYYTPLIFEAIGVAPDRVLLYTVFVGVTKVLFIFVATFLLDVVGRRILLMVSAISMTLALLGLGVCFLPGVNDGGTGVASAVVLLQCFFCAAFSVGFGPMIWVMSTEVLPLTIRSRGASVALFMNRITSGTVVLTFLTTVDTFSFSGTWFFYAGVAAVSVVFVYYVVPETKRQTLEQITYHILKGNAQQQQQNNAYAVVDDDSNDDHNNNNDHDSP